MFEAAPVQQVNDFECEALLSVLIKRWPKVGYKLFEYIIHSAVKLSIFPVNRLVSRLPDYIPYWLLTYDAP
jgi:hypothetical protein